MRPSLVVDTSALIAVAKREADASDILSVVAGFPGPVLVPASVYLEAVSVLHGSPVSRGWLDLFLADNLITFAPITEAVARRAADAFERCGRGSGHSARLNFGDCLSYAVAAEQDAPLLFKGADFAHTDVKSAL